MSSEALLPGPARLVLCSRLHPLLLRRGSYPEEEKTTEFHKHVKKCGLVWVTEPDIGSVKGFAGTFAEDDKVPGIKANLACNCDEYEKEYDEHTFFIPGRVTLGEVIQQVIAEGEKK